MGLRFAVSEISGNFSSIHLLARYLINLLYRINLLLKARKKHNFSFSANLFLYPKFKKIHNRNFDIEHSELIKKISRECHNLRILICDSISNFDPFETCILPESIVTITTNNPLIVHLNLVSCFDVYDEDLILISKHCPQLQFLRLSSSPRLTKECINHLPTSLLHLNLNSTKIAPDGVLLALNRLKRLKQLNHFTCWVQVLDLLKLQQDLKPTFLIESLGISVDCSPNFKIDRTVFDMFPKLRVIRAMDVPDLTFVNSVIENKKQNLIIKLDIHLPVDAILFIGRSCPMLEELKVNVYHDNFYCEENTTDLVPFQLLSKLDLNLIDGFLSSVDVELLMPHLKRLHGLRISHWRELDVGISVCFDHILEINPLRELENISFYDCRSTNVAMLNKLLTSLDALKYITVCKCEHISSVDREKLENVISKMNLDVTLFLR